ncbi:MAG TPA: DUF374 domain-containing protein, partial [Thermoanaerobaculia bacterium]|nr:DUF374 domain-containing protein [Thermoanaerobaculia bacterium]
MSERALASREESFQVRALGWVASGFIRLLRSTLLLRFHGQEEIRRFERENRRFLLAFWHRHLLLMVYGYRGPGITILISQHRDGALIAETVRHFGVHSSRGSSTRGAVAGVRDMLRLARSGMDL